MNAKKTLIAVAVGSLLMTGALQQALAAPAQTAQSIGVITNYSSTAYEVTSEISWAFDRGAAMGNYSNAVLPGPVITCSGSSTNCAPTNAPTSAPSAPAANVGKLQQHAQAERCTFFLGGTLTSDVNYKQSTTVNGKNGSGNWKYEWTYAITPLSSIPVAEHTAWNATVIGGATTIDIDYSGFVSSQSFMKNGTKSKYSFTMVDGDISRARNVSGQLETSPNGTDNWTAVAGYSANLNNLDTDADSTMDALAISASVDNYTYFGNGGVFGDSAVYGLLNAPDRLPAAPVNSILESDNFVANNNDLANGNVHQANFSSTWAAVPVILGSTAYYRTLVSGEIKGNSGSSGQPFNVVSTSVVTGGCTAP